LIIEVIDNKLLFGVKARANLEQEFLKRYSETIFPRIKFVDFQRFVKAVAEKAK